MTNIAQNKKRLKALKKDMLQIIDEDPAICGTANEFDGTPETYCGLWVGAEGQNLIKAKDGDMMAAFDYNYIHMDINERYSRTGVLHEMSDLLDKHESYAEYHDSGTVMIYIWENLK